MGWGRGMMTYGDVWLSYTLNNSAVCCCNILSAVSGGCAVKVGGGGGEENNNLPAVKSILQHALF